MNTSDSSMKEFCSLNGLKNLINEPTCYKNSEKPTCIDLILTNQPTLFQRTAVLETGLSDFHLLAGTEFKMSFQKCKPRIITYRNYKNYDNDVLRSEIQTFCWNQSFASSINLHLSEKNTFVQTKPLS